MLLAERLNKKIGIVLFMVLFILPVQGQQYTTEKTPKRKYENESTEGFNNVLRTSIRFMEVMFVIAMSIRLFKIYNATKKGIEETMDRFVKWLIITFSLPIFSEFIMHILGV